jgi:hypothetical protein
MLRHLLYIALWLALGSLGMTTGLLMENGPLWGLSLGLTIYKVFIHLAAMVRTAYTSWVSFRDAIHNAFSGSEHATSPES